MLSAVLEMLLTLLAAVGFASILWMFLEHRLVPGSGEESGVFTVVRGSGDGAELEQSIRSLLRLRREGLYRGTILVVDCGLDEEGKALARLLCANSEEIRFCTADELSQLIFHT